MSKYLVLGHEFRFNRNDYKGPVIASADGFYFVIEQHGLADVTGLVGAALVALNQHFGAKAAATCYTSDLSELSPEITHDPEWPVRQTTGKVLFVPRVEVETVRVPWLWLDNRVYVATRELTLSVVYNLFRRGKINRFLADAGWDVVTS